MKIDDYCRELQKIARAVEELEKSAKTNITMDARTRDDVTWEIARLKSALADCLASIVAIDQDNQD